MKIKLFVTDVDGTLTDGKIFIGENGEMMKAFCVKDGAALHGLLPEYGIPVAIITGRESIIVSNRAKELGVELVFQNVKEKLPLLKKLANERDIMLEEIAYIGDDINDLECIKAVGLGACPADAVEEVKRNAKYISKKRGGVGAVRDFVEYIISGF